MTAPPAPAGTQQPSPPAGAQARPPAPATGRPTRPVLALIAALIWILFGGLQLASGMWVLTDLILEGIGGVAIIAMLFPILFGLGFTLVGLQTITGGTSHTLMNAIGSVIIGVLFGVLAIVGGSAHGSGLATAISLIFPATLVVAGVLLFFARADYDAWHRSRAK